MNTLLSTIAEILADWFSRKAAENSARAAERLNEVSDPPKESMPNGPVHKPPTKNPNPDSKG